MDIVRGHWGQTVPAGSLLDGDPSGDGLVGSADLDIVRANWGRTAAAAFAESVEADDEFEATSAKHGRFTAGNQSLAEAAWQYELEALKNRHEKNEKDTIVDAVFALRFFGPTLDS